MARMDGMEALQHIRAMASRVGGHPYDGPWRGCGENRGSEPRRRLPAETGNPCSAQRALFEALEDNRRQWRAQVAADTSEG